MENPLEIKGKGENEDVLGEVIKEGGGNRKGENPVSEKGQIYKRSSGNPFPFD